jgi:hypothetical protein
LRRRLPRRTARCPCSTACSFCLTISVWFT